LLVGAEAASNLLLEAALKMHLKGLLYIHDLKNCEEGFEDKTSGDLGQSAFVSFSFLSLTLKGQENICC
jgi:hypothetical protein